MDIQATLAAIFLHLRAALAAAAHKHVQNPPLHSLMIDAYHYAGRLSRRLLALYARWQAGTLPTPRPRAPPVTSPPPPTPPPPPPSPAPRACPAAGPPCSAATR